MTLYKCDRCGKEYDIGKSYRGHRASCQRKQSSEQIRKRINTKRANGSLSNNLGTRHTPEAKANMSSSRIGKKLSQETKDKISVAHKGIPESSATIERMRQRAKKLWQDPGYQDNQSAARGRKYYLPDQYSNPERHVQKVLDKLRLESKHNPWVGKYRPDFLVNGEIIIEVDGCYYHECPWHGRGDYPDKPRKDLERTEYFLKRDLVVIRIWECQVYQASEILGHL